MKILKLLIITGIIGALIACDEEKEPTETYQQYFSSERLIISGSHLYSVNEKNIIIYDIDEVDKIEESTIYNNGTNIQKLFTYENALIANVDYDKYRVLDISEPDKIDDISRLSIDTKSDFALINGFAYSIVRTEFSSYLNTYDISDIANPERLNLSYVEAPTSMVANSNYLFICDTVYIDNGENQYSKNTLKIYDRSDPANITPINFAEAIDCNKMLLEDDLLINHSYYNIQVYDVSTVPPVLLHQISKSNKEHS